MTSMRLGWELLGIVATRNFFLRIFSLTKRLLTASVEILELQKINLLIWEKIVFLFCVPFKFSLCFDRCENLRRSYTKLMIRWKRRRKWNERNSWVTVVRVTQEKMPRYMFSPLTNILQNLQDITCLRRRFCRKYINQLAPSLFSWQSRDNSIFPSRWPSCYSALWKWFKARQNALEASVCIPAHSPSFALQC